MAKLPDRRLAHEYWRRAISALLIEDDKASDDARAELAGVPGHRKDGDEFQARLDEEGARLGAHEQPKVSEEKSR